MGSVPAENATPAKLEKVYNILESYCPFAPQTNVGIYPEYITELEQRKVLNVLAEAAILKGQSYSIGSRSLTRADLREVKKAIDDLNKQLAALRSGNQITQHRVVPRDI